MDRTKVYPPGTSDIRIVMEHSRTLWVHVVDAESGEPIERFGYNVLLDNSSYSGISVFSARRKPEFGDHAGGRAEIAFRIGRDLVLVAAPGHTTATIDIDPARQPERPYVLRLQRSATVFGICVESGDGVAKATVRLEPGGESSFDGAPPSFHVDRSKVVSLTTEADGSFRFENVDPGHYRIVVLAPSGAARMLDPFDVSAGKPIDLGRVELEAAATIRGRILLPPGRALAGRTIRLDDRFTVQ